MPAFRAPFWPRDWTCVSCISGGLFITEPLGKPYICMYKYICTHICTYIYMYRWIYLVCIHNGILATEKSEISPLVTTWMDLQSIKLGPTDTVSSELYVKSRKEDRWTDKLKNENTLTDTENRGSCQSRGRWEVGQNMQRALRSINF